MFDVFAGTQNSLVPIFFSIDLLSPPPPFGLGRAYIQPSHV